LAQEVPCRILLKLDFQAMLRFTLVAGVLADSATAQKYARGFVRQAFNGVPEVVTVTDADLAATPSSIDWSELGATTPVKDQGQCGSCWAYSTTEGIESAIYMAQGTLPELAVQQIISCDKTDGGCQGGDLPTAFDYVQNTAGGIDSDSDYPQTSNVRGRTGHCKWDGNQVASVTSWKYAVPPCTGGACDNQDEAALAAVVAKSGPVSICVNAASWDPYTSGVFTGDCNPAYNDMDHCVQLVGFDTAASTPYWKVRNSWSADWGEAGFIRLPYGVNACSVASEAVLPTAVLLEKTASLVV